MTKQAGNRSYTLTPEIAAYIRALEAKNQKLEEENRAQKDALVRLQSLNEQLVCLRKRMFGQSSEKIEYVDWVSAVSAAGAS